MGHPLASPAPYAEVALQTRTARVDRRFRLVFERVWRVRLTFSKPGYRDAELAYTTAPGVDPHHDLYQTEVRARNVAEERLTLVLRRN